MEINFQKELGKNYMILEGGKTRSDYAFRVICENEIEGMLKVETSRLDGDVTYYYEIDGLNSLEKSFYRRSMTAEDVATVLDAIVALPDTLDEYLLNKDNVILSPETIFLTSDFQKVYFCYYPDDSSDYMGEVKEICTYFLKKIDHQDQEAVTLAYSAFEISSRDNYALSEIKNILPKQKPQVADEERYEERVDVPKDEENKQKSVSFDDLLDFREDDFDIDYKEYDLYEEESLPRYSEKQAPDVNKNYIYKIVPTLVIVLTGIILFAIDATSSMSLVLRIGCFAMVSLATLLLTYLLWMRGKGAAEK